MNADVNSNSYESANLSSGKAVSVVYAKPKKEKEKSDGQEDSLYYARSDSHDTEPAIGVENSNLPIDNGEGWEDNAAYSSLEDKSESPDPREREDDEADGVEEGWEDNSLYNVNDATNALEEEEWVDNSIYAGSDDEE